MKHIIHFLLLFLLFASCNNYSNDVPVTDVSINPTSLTLIVGETVEIVTTISPKKANSQDINWSSSNELVAKVDKGKVTALKAGYASITANVGGRSATCDISVKEGSFVAVDMGGSVKWANTNLGATSPEDFGDYYAWGELKTKSFYSWENYKWCNGSIHTLTKYNTENSCGTVDKKTVLEASDDVAHVNLGGKWRIPTDEEWNKLRQNCYWTWKEFNGVKGFWVTSKKNGNSIFLPAAGAWGDTGIYREGQWGYYHSSTLSTTSGDGPTCMWAMSFSYSSKIGANVTRGYGTRCVGTPVRPVLDY